MLGSGYFNGSRVVYRGFEDVTVDDWYYGVAGASRKYNIVNGFDDNTFRGDNVISKEQFAALVSRTLFEEKQGDIGKDKQELKFKDIDEISAWALEYIGYALAEELIPEEEYFNPKAEVTRAEATVILYRLYNKI